MPSALEMTYMVAQAFLLSVFNAENKAWYVQLIN